MQAKLILGLFIGVVKDDATKLARGYGTAKLEHYVPATESTVYQKL